MKISMTEFRNMVAEAVRRTVSEAKKKPKEIAPRSEESIQAQRDAMVRGLPGYSHGRVLDMSKPLGKRSRTKRQGAAGIGGWTSEGRMRECEMDVEHEDDRIYKILDVLRGAGIDGHKAIEAAEMIVQRLDGNGEAIKSIAPLGALGMEQKNEAIRKLVRMIVREEIRVRR